jgi:hypothetical protein
MTDPLPPPPRKDRLIQTRVPRDLESTLKKEARRQGVTVSQLIRNILGGAFELVEDVVADVDQIVTGVDQIVTDSVALAQQVSRGARRIAESARSGTATDPLDLVEAWNRVVLNRDVTCTKCRAMMVKGEEGYAGLRGQAGPIRAWLCSRCIGMI